MDCPEDFLKIFLLDLPSGFVNRVTERPHWKPPVWKGCARQISWKCYNIEEVKQAFDKSSIPLVASKCFNGLEEVAEIPLSGTQAIALAKARASGIRTAVNKQPTCKASLVVGEGEGRATREFEIIWWPDLYSTPQRGKIAFHYYVGKALFNN